MSTAPAAQRWTPWALRAAWVAVLVTGGWALESADGSTAAAWSGLAAWVVGVAAMAVPAVRSLTATRIVVPASVPAAATIWIAGAHVVDGALMTGASTVAATLALSSPLGRAFVQASAYGDEDRHVLRPPIGYGVVAVLAWAVWSAVWIGTVIAIATEHWVSAAIAGVAALAATVVGAPRWHRLSRRWLVFVPAGVVIHDALVLGETVMLRRQEIASIGLALEGTGAADLTGPAAGHAIEIRTRQAITVLLAATPARPAAIHLTACLIAPSRPGQVLLAADGRRLPVGAAV